MEVTDEMIDAFGKARHLAEGARGMVPGSRRRAGIAAVLAIVEREHVAEIERRADVAYEIGLTHGARQVLEQALERLPQ